MLSLFSKGTDNHVLFRIYNATPQLKASLSSFDIWKQDMFSVDVLMTTSNFETLNLNNTQYKVLNDNIQSQIDAETNKKSLVNKIPTPTAFKTDNTWFEHYFNDFNDYEVTKNWYKTLATTYPEVVEYVPSIGKSIEGRDIFAIFITGQEFASKKQFYIESLIHAREWATGSTSAYIAWELVKGFSENNKVIVNLLNQIEVIIVPIVNPDGYAYSHSIDRMWRKNRRKVNKIDYGVDLNRNFQDGYWYFKFI